VCELLRETRLAAAADAGERKEPRVAQQPGAILERLFATDESRAGKRQVVRMHLVIIGDAVFGQTFSGKRCNELVSPSRNRGNGVGSEQLAQAADLHVQVVFFDHQSRPDRIEQLRLVDDAIPSLDERNQQIKRARAHGGRVSTDQELALSGANFAAAESIVLRHGLLRNDSTAEG